MTIDPAIFVSVFRAAAEGVMRPYNGVGMTCDGESYDRAKSMAGAFDAIADLFDGIARSQAIAAIPGRPEPIP